jgi:hypothetical protein
MVLYTERFERQQSEFWGRYERRFWSPSSSESHKDFEGFNNGVFETFCPLDHSGHGASIGSVIPSRVSQGFSSVCNDRLPTASKQVSSRKNVAQPKSESLIPAARSYRKETAELIKQLDAILLRGIPSTTNTKRKRKNAVENQARPRSRNVVLKLAADMIWKLQCDEEVICFFFWIFRSF